MMNLYLFNDNNEAMSYGIGSYLRELTHALENSGITMHIVHLHAARFEFEIVKTNQVENWYIPKINVENFVCDTFKKLEAYYKNVIYFLRLNMKETNELIFHFNFNNYQFLAKELKASFTCKTVHTVHFTKWAFDLNGNLSRYHTIKMKPENQRSSFEQMLYEADEYESLLYKEVDRIIVLSAFTRNHLCQEYGLQANKLSVIANGLEDVLFDNGKFTIDNGIVLRKKLRISEKEFVILFAGKLNERKGLVFLIRAFRKVLEILPNCRLIIAGNGKYDIFMKECDGIWPQIHWTGFLNKDSLHELYSVADIGVVPSLHEPFGLVAVEMMMHGLPLIATATSGLNEVVDDTCGLKIPIIENQESVEIDSGLLAEKIKYLFQNPEDRQRMGQNARKRYEEKYSMEMFRKNMLNFYHSLYE